MSNERATCRDCGYPKSGRFKHDNCNPYHDLNRSHFEMSFEEIAQKLGISRQAVEQTYARALAKLRRAFKRDGLTNEVMEIRDAAIAKGDNVPT